MFTYFYRFGEKYHQRPMIFSTSGDDKPNLTFVYISITFISALIKTRRIYLTH